MRQLAFALSFSFSLALTAASADTTPLDPNGFTERLVTEIKRALPSDDVSVKATLQLRIALKKEGAIGDHILRLDSLYEFCRDVPDQCEMAIAKYTAELPGFYASRTQALEAKTLRIVVRPSAYVTKGRTFWGSQEMPARLLAADLWLVGVADQPNAIRMLKPLDLKALNLSSDQAMKVAQDNTRAELKSVIAQLQKDAVTSHAIITLMGYSYASSLLALDDVWAGIAKAMDGRVIAMAPYARFAR